MVIVAIGYMASAHISHGLTTSIKLKNNTHPRILAGPNFSAVVEQQLFLSLSLIPRLAILSLYTNKPQ